MGWAPGFVGISVPGMLPAEVNATAQKHQGNSSIRWKFDRVTFFVYTSAFLFPHGFSPPFLFVYFHFSLPFLLPSLPPLPFFLPLSLSFFYPFPCDSTANGLFLAPRTALKAKVTQCFCGNNVLFSGYLFIVMPYMCLALDLSLTQESLRAETTSFHSRVVSWCRDMGPVGAQ